MKINWKVRLKNPIFWVQLVIAVITPVLAYMGLTARDITTWAALGNMLLQAVANPYVVVLVIGSVYNAVIDPTTTGVSDSSRAMLYDKPSNIKG